MIFYLVRLCYRVKNACIDQDVHYNKLYLCDWGILMRIDKFLKISRMVKRRTVAQEMIMAGLVKLNGRAAKPSSSVREGDVIEVAFPRRILKVQVLCDDDLLLKRGKEAYRVLGDHLVDKEDNSM